MREHKSLKELSDLLGIVPTSVGRKVDEAARIMAIIEDADPVAKKRIEADALQDLRREREYQATDLEITNRARVLNGKPAIHSMHRS